MSENESWLFAAEYNKNFPELDLHGFGPDDDVEGKIDVFLYKNFKEKKENDEQQAARIIYGIGYGIGDGVMEKKTLSFLEKHPMVEEILPKSGYCIIRF